MNEIMNIKNVRGYLDKNGTVYLNAEDVARGFGFTQKQNKGSKTYTSIRWETVNRYLRGFGFPQNVGENDFLPENMVYRLGFKASNETAQKFQGQLADEILPCIRKHGAYMTEDTIKKALTSPDFLIRLATELKTEKEAREKAELEAASAKQVIGELKPKADYTDRILLSKGTVPTTAIAKDYGMSARTLNKKLHELHVIYKMGDQWFLYAGYQAKGYTHSKTFDFRHSDGKPDCKMHTEWTQKGRLFLYDLLKRNGILPLIEQDE